MTPEAYRAMSERDRMEFALSRGMAAVAGRHIVFAGQVGISSARDAPTTKVFDVVDVSIEDIEDIEDDDSLGGWRSQTFAVARAEEEAG